ncbi:hypothetical protein LEAN103870_14620 [Legionella anisa]|uniref:2'-5' RNA ligase family protein n=2 Tax=Legionella anisa TaxID=28082 RepID=A0AAX0WUD4_9GAMM|nr:hypothetical protein [Legionella anisa]AWN74165.1 hypothetical protein DLD14_10090 [Legionella anisa]KTC71449.1 hypothetical protein Lani_1797 [Legionella anisa]MBN5935191.1 hypothetical protein [Legionella anisa]MCW8425806.1 hypothetical protein [Legionella anisa]MCW8448763.1 hypothetical protein [Legionella anisa]
MKKQLITTLFSLMYFSLSFAAKPTDLVLLLRVNPTDKTKIYDQFVKESVIGKDNYTNKKNMPNYHVTLGWIVNGKSDKNLEKMMKDELKAESPIDYFFGESGIYQVSPSCPKPTPNNKKCTRNAIVLFPEESTKAELKNINLKLTLLLKKYNQDYHTNFKMYADIIPENYTPHISLAATKRVLPKNREKAVVQLNDKIKDSSFKYTKVK